MWKRFMAGTRPTGSASTAAAWFISPQPSFGCLPGQVAEIKLHADHSAKKGGLFSLGTELFEIIMA